jgi:hypothetical protein
MLWAAAVVQWIERAPPKTSCAIVGIGWLSARHLTPPILRESINVGMDWVRPVQPHN